MKFLFIIVAIYVGFQVVPRALSFNEKLVERKTQIENMYVAYK
jgi:hypothetical protein